VSYYVKNNRGFYLCGIPSLVDGSLDGYFARDKAKGIPWNSEQVARDVIEQLGGKAGPLTVEAVDQVSARQAAGANRARLHAAIMGRRNVEAVA
jgi:hypothetical protein